MTGKRNYGVDGLRILAMYMIVFFHMQVHGGISSQIHQEANGYAAAGFMAIAAYCAVNCYALISGYVCVSARFKWSGILYLWLQVVFYGVLIACVLRIAMPQNIPGYAWKQGFLPVIHHNYWYYTAYFAMSFFIPLMNASLYAAPKRELGILMIAAVCLFSLFPTILQEDRFSLSNGYSVWWLIILYLLGGYIRLYGQECRFFGLFARWGLLIYFCVTIAVWLLLTIIQMSGSSSAVVNTMKMDFWLRYDSPFMLLQACALLVWFAEAKPSESVSRWIEKAAPLTFGVYLIHDNPHVRENLIEGSFGWMAELNAGIYIFVLLGIALVIFAVCMLIDYLRLKLFRYLRIKEACQRLFEQIGLP